MRKHSVRKWLHAILDLLPVILIPVFMIYSHRHDMTERTQVDIQYKYQSNLVNSESDLVIGNIYTLNTQDKQISDLLNNVNDTIVFSLLSDLHFKEQPQMDDAMSSFPFFAANTVLTFRADNNTYYIDSFYSFNQWYDFNYNISYTFEGFFSNNCLIQLLDFTANNPFLVENLSYTDFNVIDSVNVEDTNSDIMSVVMNDLNNVTENYFNMDKTFNLGAIHDWVNANMFQNEPPLVANIVWHIISYEFIMDLIFLVYAVFMFIIDFADRCINAFFDKSFGGGR